jgi:hypothetical protein
MQFLDVTLEPRVEPEPELEYKKPAYNWMYENSINNGKQIIDIDKQQEFKYDQWRTNISLSNFRDTIFAANEMNTNYHISDKLHYHFLFYITRKQTRYGKKKTDEDKKLEKQIIADKEELRSIQEYYKYNIAKAKAARRILTKDQLEFIKKNKKKVELNE